jgi:hypothetical protein
MYWAFHGTRLTRSETVQLIDDHDNGFLNLKKVPVIRPYIAIYYDIQSCIVDDEEFIQVPGWPYMASSRGTIHRILSDETYEKALNTSPNSKGYHSFSPSHGIDKRGIKPFVHSWIALAFYGPCPEGKSVDHINQVKTDNRAINLRYATPSEQAANRTLNFKVIPRNVSKNASLSTLSRRMERRKLTPICSRL